MWAIASMPIIQIALHSYKASDAVFAPKFHHRCRNAKRFEHLVRTIRQERWRAGQNEFDCCNSGIVECAALLIEFPIANLKRFTYIARLQGGSAVGDRFCAKSSHALDYQQWTTSIVLSLHRRQFRRKQLFRLRLRI